jgi:type I restriction enzyme S subunit
MKWQAYPRYKDSGIKWLGKIPEHWEVRRLKTVSHFAYGDSLAADDRVPGDYDVFGSNGIVGQHNVANTQGPCLIIGRKGSFGKVVYSERPCFAIDTTYFVDASQTDTHLRWLFYCLQWLKLDSYSKDSAVPGLAREDAYKNPIPYCQPDEQRAIAAFLDRETERIDALIARKERQIELLQEKRAALISRAVTKGLDPDASMKDSGIEWLGEIPAHWEARRLKTVSRFAYGDSLAADARVPGDYDVYGSNGIVGQHNLANTQGPCLIVGRKGSFGKVVYSEQPCFAIDTTYFVDASQTSSDLRWLLYCLQWSKLDAYSKDSAVPGLAREDAYENRVPYCQPSEQRSIAAFLDCETAKLDTLIAKVQESIERLHEYRTALISAAVTGKIQVQRT